jgi:phospholipid/cholesterol/gamma-HCH transport system permease protein
VSSQPIERTRRPIDRRFPRLAQRVDGWTAAWNQVGVQTKFYGRTLRSIGYVFTHYRIELMRIIAQMGLGTGALVVIGGTVAIVGFLTVTTGALVAVQGYTDFSEIGVEALTGFASAFFNVRLIAPATTAIALAATIGAGATAQLGAMRINEEIDALEVMGIRSIAYLASTRVIAGLVVVIPLYCVGVLASFWAARFGTTVIYGQSTGVYDHYFRTFLNPTDLVWSFVQSIAMAVVIMLIHTYYGFTASGGPAGVGEAVGRAVRTSLIVAAFVVMMISLAVYGQSGNFNLAG